MAVSTGIGTAEQQPAVVEESLEAAEKESPDPYAHKTRDQRDEPGEFEVLADVATVKPTDLMVRANKKSSKRQSLQQAVAKSSGR